MTTTATLERIGQEVPTRKRFGVLAFACALSMITYLDRVCMGAASGSVVDDLGLSGPADLKWAFTLFAVAYAAFEVPSGWLGDVFGPRTTLIRIVLWWSIFTALTGAVGIRVGSFVFGGIGLLVAIRFLFGMGEAGAYPNITRALHNWFPYQERGLTQGTVWMSGRLMGGLTPAIWTVLISGIVLENGTRLTPALMSWRAAFWVFGVLGLIWCLLFRVYFRNRPEEKSDVNAAELAWIRSSGAETHQAELAGVPWKRILTSGNLWALCLMYACGAYGWYFNITYLPSFIEEQHAVPSTSMVGALYKGGPLLLGACGCLIGGLLTDWYIRRTGNRKLGRRLFGVVGHSACALCYLACLVAWDAFSFFVAISLAAFFNDLTMGPAWATAQDIGRRYAAIASGCMNTIGNLGGALAGWVTGSLLEHAQSAHADSLHLLPEQLSQAQRLAGSLKGYQWSLLSFAIVYAIAVVLWLVIDPTKPVAEEPANP